MPIAFATGDAYIEERLRYKHFNQAALESVAPSNIHGSCSNHGLHMGTMFAALGPHVFGRATQAMFSRPLITDHTHLRASAAIASTHLVA
jgi:hypothetical protein